MSSQICLPDVLHIPHRNYVGFVAQSFGFLSLSLLANVALAMCHTACAAGIIIIACPARPDVRSPIEAGMYHGSYDDDQDGFDSYVFGFEICTGQR